MTADQETKEEPAVSGDAPKPRNVVEALAAVARDVDAVAKNRKGPQQQGGFAYRGIEDVLNALHRPLSEHGVVLVPHVVEWSQREIGSKGWHKTTVTVDYEVYGPGGVDDRLPRPIRVTADGDDNSDKGFGKAMSYAYKTALGQLFHLPTEDDNEATPPPVRDRERPQQQQRSQQRANGNGRPQQRANGDSRAQQQQRRTPPPPPVTSRPASDSDVAVQAWELWQQIQNHGGRLQLDAKRCLEAEGLWPLASLDDDQYAAAIPHLESFVEEAEAEAAEGAYTYG